MTELIVPFQLPGLEQYEAMVVARYGGQMLVHEDLTLPAYPLSSPNMGIDDVRSNVACGFWAETGANIGPDGLRHAATLYVEDGPTRRTIAVLAARCSDPSIRNNELHWHEAAKFPYRQAPSHYRGWLPMISDGCVVGTFRMGDGMVALGRLQPIAPSWPGKFEELPPIAPFTNR